MVLSLDVSTSCTGVAIFTNEGELMFADYIDLNKETKNNAVIGDERFDFDVLIQKADVIINYIHQKITVADYDLTDVVIEASLMASNNAKTVVLLAKFNSMISYRIYEEFGVIPYHIPVAEWRKYGFPDVHRHKGDDVKKLYADVILAKYPDIQLDLNRNGSIDKRNYDMLDAIGIGIGWFGKQKASINCTKTMSKPKKTRKKKTQNADLQ